MELFEENVVERLAKIFADLQKGSEGEKTFVDVMRIIFYDKAFDVVEEKLERECQTDEEACEAQGEEYEKEWFDATAEIMDPYHSRDVWATPCARVIPLSEATNTCWKNSAFEAETIKFSDTDACCFSIVIASGLWKGEKRWVLSFDEDAKTYLSLETAENAATRALATLARSLPHRCSENGVAKDIYPRFAPASQTAPRAIIAPDGIFGDLLKEQMEDARLS